MNSPVKNIALQEKIFAANDENFLSLALEVFHFQYAHNAVYRQYCDILKINPDKVKTIRQIPFLPIGFFKTHRIVTTDFETNTVFESSGTTQMINSRHYVKDAGLYAKSFSNAFRLFYGEPADWCILALLPSYLERNNSSLVVMADLLIRESGHAKSDFYLNEWERLSATISELEKQGQKTLLLGVTFALLDFAELYPAQLNHTTIMETGGMKGRREEMIRQQVHGFLCNSFGVEKIHSEYGMTELLSQAYSSGDGLFNCPPWMKIVLREEDDPFAIQPTVAGDTINGAINVIDLANIYSCSFIATEDAGKLYANGSFEVLGRLDSTDIRGCSLLAL